jgi:hypothetical protein
VAARTAAALVRQPVMYCIHVLIELIYCIHVLIELFISRALIQEIIGYKYRRSIIIILFIFNTYFLILG